MSDPLSQTPPPHATRGQRWALLAGLVVVVWLGLRLFASVLLPFVAAAGVAYFLDPLAVALERRGLRRAGAAGLLIIALLAGGLLFALLLYPLIVAQIGILFSRLPTYADLIRSAAETLIAHLQERLGLEYVDQKLRDLVGSQAGAMLGFLATALSQLVGGGFALFNVLTLLVVTPVVSFYLLRDWPGVVSRIDSWLPRRYEAILRAQAREVDRILSAWLRGQAICCVALALYYAVALSAVGLDLGLLVGLASGMLSFIPYVGSITGALTALLLAGAQFQTWTGVLMVMGVFVVGQLLEGYVIYPRFLGDRVELHAVWVIFALFAGGAAFGFVGVLLAVPVAATIGVLCRFWLRRYLASPLYLDNPSGQAPRIDALQPASGGPVVKKTVTVAPGQRRLP
jgi:predicted PurR-regulated permease PerM